MSENMNIEATETVETVETAVVSEKYTLDYVLEQIEKIQADTEHIKSVICELGQNIQDPSGFRGEALGDVVKCRETTNQQLIAFYEKMYDDLKPKAAETMDPQLKVYSDLLNFDKTALPTEFRRRILIQMVEYAEQLKTNKVQSDLDSQDINLKKIELLLAHLSECQNDVAATALANELEKLMNI